MKEQQYFVATLNAAAVEIAQVVKEGGEGRVLSH